MTPRDLKRIGQRLYGQDWQSPLGRALGVHRITVWRWLAGKTPIPEDMAVKIRKLKER